MKHYIFDLDDTLLFSEIIKKRTYFDHVKILAKEGKISYDVAKKGLAVVDDVLFHKGEKDVFDTARQTLRVLSPDLTDEENDKVSREYVAEQMDLLRHHYQTEVKEVQGVSVCLHDMAQNGSVLGINTGNQISFARTVVKDREWPISENCVFGAGDTPEDKPYSLQMKIDNIYSFAQQVALLKPDQYKSADDALKDVVMVGDGVFDYQAAKAIGCQFIGVKPHETSKLDQFNDFESVKNFSEFHAKYLKDTNRMDPKELRKIKISSQSIIDVSSALQKDRKEHQNIA